MYSRSRNRTCCLNSRYDKRRQTENACEIKVYTVVRQLSAKCVFSILTMKLEWENNSFPCESFWSLLLLLLSYFYVRTKPSSQQIIDTFFYAKLFVSVIRNSDQNYQLASDLDHKKKTVGFTFRTYFLHVSFRHIFSPVINFASTCNNCEIFELMRTIIFINTRFFLLSSTIGRRSSVPITKRAKNADLWKYLGSTRRSD